MNQIRDAAVLGAGIAGSSLAKALADRGWDVVLVDRHSFPRHKVCGEFLSPESRSMLSRLGLHEAVESLQPSLIDRARLFFGDGKPLELPLPGTAIGVSRHSLDAALHRAALQAGVHIQTGAAVTSIAPDGNGYAIETKQGGVRAILRARAVIAAWGANGRSALLSDHRPEREGQQPYIGVKSHFAGIEMEPAVELYFVEGGYVGLSPVEGGLVNAAALLKRSAFPNTEKSILGWLNAAGRRNPALHGKLNQAIPVHGTQTAVAPVQLHRKPMPWGVIPHVGDAALMLPPLCGDGMAMALRSAILCATLADRYLSGAISRSEWKHAYTAAILREFNGPLKWGRLLQWLSGVPVLPRMLFGAARLSPGLANGLVQATRLKESDI
ncbi:NAD(P)/FAD-dependent oxidoreductase [Paenibacillus sp. R14(2021)]|uniref:NAD(P)/FAD-dependent oxidoreductase n=1 Tax=Paenibacillus sp. R14(2021) TaxID=2859228 RepID=UPI001C615CC6|nr:NAD(P)/FAD-dependent oxidoreductase [Paenibacillus sp. R14(2021)]